MDGRTAAAVLGVRPGATKQEIRRAFRARAKQVHPDLQPPQAPAATAFVTVRAAFELLLATAPDAAPADGSAPAPSAPSAPSVVAPARWLGAPQARSAATIDLTDAAGSARRPATVPQQPPAARAGAAFARCLAAELARH